MLSLGGGGKPTSMVSLHEGSPSSSAHATPLLVIKKVFKKPMMMMDEEEESSSSVHETPLLEMKRPPKNMKLAFNPKPMALNIKSAYTPLAVAKVEEVEEGPRPVRPNKNIPPVDQLAQWNTETFEMIPSDVARARMIVDAAMAHTGEQCPYIYRRKERAWWRGVTLYTLGLVLCAEGNDVDALRQLRQSLKLTHGTAYSVKGGIEIAEVLIRMKEADHAFTYVNAAVADATTLQEDELIALATLTLSRVQRASVKGAERGLAQTTWERALRVAVLSLGANHRLTEHIRSSQV